MHLSILLQKAMLEVDLKKNLICTDGKGIWEPGYLDLILSGPTTVLPVYLLLFPSLDYACFYSTGHRSLE